MHLTKEFLEKKMSHFLEKKNHVSPYLDYNFIMVMRTGFLKKPTLLSHIYLYLAHSYLTNLKQGVCHNVVLPFILKSSLRIMGIQIMHHAKI
jgi:hypothetical protein